MGFILQQQRRAIEAVFSPIALTLFPDCSFVFEGTPLNLLGVSEGVGTCANVKDINVAVFSMEFPFNPEFHRLPEFPTRCLGAVILRNPTKIEIDELKKERHYLEQGRLAVEGLRFAAVSPKQFRFQSNGRSTTYVRL